ncbi:hypothetical protein KP004_17615 [Geomonas oryzisoli]|uniref:DUF1570 domain-containing protein n=1 Tax=Geomonas oryzisoli TaxID=2847992 RepID=A0ABX8J3H6_9BACT|nr:hypothetical protein [Geomonas oryzisoli]QWV92965.1 hypothetical protein KP004_17615 [Geomonas oryzisoli]
MRIGTALSAAMLFALALQPKAGAALEQRKEVSNLKGPYNAAFFHRENGAFRVGAAIHFAHGIQHDFLQLEPLAQHEETDRKADLAYLEMIHNPPQTEPKMELYGPYTARTMWQLYRAIDWTHMHHEQTYDILADRDIPWDRKKRWTDRAVAYYLEKLDIPRSPAPLDVTLRRAAVMMKPYATLFRNNYPKSNNFFFAAHWWHPAIYEAQMLGGNGKAQEEMVRDTDRTLFTQVLKERPQRMLLSREMMPRYSRMSPESANIFDNLHMLHGIAYDLLSYEGWTVEQKRDELYRVIKAMSYHPGDEKLARKFSTPHPDMDPRLYEPWMKGTEGEMNRIMMEMMEEMMPLMMPGQPDPLMKAQMMEQFKKKMTPGMQEGELPGSLMDALKKVMPQMQMSPESMEPGQTPQKMVDVMMKGWQDKYGAMPDVAPMPMEQEPAAPRALPEGGSL